jgi:hypothetical protein
MRYAVRQGKCATKVFYRASGIEPAKMIGDLHTEVKYSLGQSRIILTNPLSSKNQIGAQLSTGVALEPRPTPGAKALIDSRTGRCLIQTKRNFKRGRYRI